MHELVSASGGFPGLKIETGGTRRKRFAATLRGAHNHLDAVPRVSLRFTLGYFRIFPMGRTTLSTVSGVVSNLFNLRIVYEPWNLAGTRCVYSAQDEGARR